MTKIKFRYILLRFIIIRSYRIFYLTNRISIFCYLFKARSTKNSGRLIEFFFFFFANEILDTLRMTYDIKKYDLHRRSIGREDEIFIQSSFTMINSNRYNLASKWRMKLEKMLENCFMKIEYFNV